MSLQKIPPDRTLTFTERHPVISQAWDDALELSVQQIGLPSVMTGATLFISWWLGQITSLGSAVIPIVGSVFAGLLLYILIAIIRAPFIVIKRQRQQITELNQKLQRMEAQSTLGILPEPREPEDEPNIVCLGREFLLGELDQHYIFSEDNGESALAIVATFCNEETPERHISSVEYVQARIIYDGVDWKTLRIHRGVWVSEEYNSTSFYPGDTRRLIIAIKNRNEPFITFADNRENVDRYDPPTPYQLDADRYEVKVTLTIGGQILKEFPFRLILGPEDENIELIYIKDGAD